MSMDDVRIDGNGRVYKLPANKAQDKPYLSVVGVLQADDKGTLSIRLFKPGDPEYGDRDIPAEVKEKG